MKGRDSKIRKAETAVDEASDRQLMRLLHGELEPAETRSLEARLAREPALAERYARLERDWGELELPPATVPAGFRAAVLARARVRGATELRFSTAPLWVRAGATAALLVGIAAGAGLGRLGMAPTPPEDWAYGPPSLAERYWQSIEASGGSLDGRDRVGESPDGETPRP